MAHKSLLRWLALLVLLLNFLPIAAFAQEINEDLVGVYVSDTIENEDSGATLDITLTLFDDGTIEAVTVSTDGDETATDLETGSWQDNGDDTITIVIEEYNGEPYEEPIEITLEAVDGMLHAADLTDFGEDGLMLTLTDDEPVSVAEEMLADLEASADEEEADAEDEEEVEPVELPGLWLTTEIDADGTPAGVVLYLGEDNTAQSTVTMFGEAVQVITRMGEWEDDGEGLVTVTMTAELDAEGEAVDLDDPEAVEFEFDGTSLINEVFTFYPDENLLAASEEEMSDEEVSDEEAEAEEAAAAAAGSEADLGDSVTFMSPMGALMEGNIVVLLLLENGIASMSTQLGLEAEQLVETGTWEESGEGEITVTLTADEEGNEYDEPSVLIFAADEDTGSLVGVDYDPDIYGEELVLEMSGE